MNLSNAAQSMKCARVLFLGLTLALLMSSCAGFSHRTQSARDALDKGKTEEALKLYNEELGVESAEDTPAELGGETSLLLLDRAMILQSLGKNKLSSRDLQVADKQIEILDFSKGALDSLGRYMFSDDTGPYRAPRYEKLLINTANMLNYLQVHDLSGAAVEARRFTVMQNFFKDEAEGAAWLGLGSYLAGFISEKRGQPSEALRYYDEALKSEGIAGLDSAVVRLAAKSGYRTPTLEKVLSAHSEQGSQSALGPDMGEVLVVVQNGRIGAKVAKRIPIGLALTYAGGGISPENSRRANELSAQGLVTWVNFPMMQKPKPSTPPRLWVNGAERRLALALEVDDRAFKTWRAVRGSLIASAITRTISRVVAGQVARKASGGGALGLALGLATQATLTATDTPDTRSWAVLPAKISLARLVLPAGHHEFRIQTKYGTRRATVDLDPKGWSVLNLTTLR